MKNLCKALTALLCMVCLVAGLTVPALAAIPNRPSNQYVLDDAGVLSDSTEDKIVAKNKELFEKYGAEVVIVAVDFLGGKDIDDYAYDLFNDWGIGSSERNNGILLVLAIAEDDYYALSGYGLEDYFDGAKFRELLDDCLEDDFAGGDYDRGVQKFFDEVVGEIEDYYDGYEDEYTQRDEDEYIQWNEDEYFRSGPSHWSWLVGRFVVLVIVIISLVSVFGRNRGGRGGPPYGGGGRGGNFWAGMMLGNMMGRSHRRNTWGAPPPPPPPRGGFGGGPRPGGFSGGGRSGGFGGFTGGGRTGGFGGRSGGGGFHGGGGSHGGGAGRR